ncbi:hypothetical protein R77567_01619 [Ralstonia sp. LMG 32965]|uniref:Uncharacterized protein n=1 Tax=Ralstonia flatus TaxID=3058601 RepID=A0AAD2C268_9RALS|nr:hypothetical protein [Ralstonia sp. LMG 32965]MBN6211433.1 hypothetical protein [Ralstonia pickettii]CAJ0862123.1 hypothetical protein R77567_01619 [Ralstonia sp. LMG 32965]
MADKIYRANWQVSGLGKKDLKEGDTVKLDEDDAAHLVKLGALSPADAKPTAPEGGGE